MPPSPLKWLAGAIQPFCGMALGVFLLAAGCSSTPPKVENYNWNEERISLLSEKVRAQESKIKRLNDELEYYKKEKPKPPAVKQLVSVPVQTAVPKEKVVPTEAKEPDFDDETEIASSEEGEAGRGETIADSSHASLHGYFQGLRLFESGSYETALKEFSRFVSENPNHVYADRAEYFVAESHFRTQDYGLAVVATNRLESRYPYSFRLPEALLRRAESFENLGQVEEARNTLRELLKRFPGDKVAGSVSRKLAMLSTKSRTVEAPATPLLLDD